LFDEKAEKTILLGYENKDDEVDIDELFKDPDFFLDDENTEDSDAHTEYFSTGVNDSDGEDSPIENDNDEDDYSPTEESGNTSNFKCC
jgi:hypothetical protein